MSLNCAEIDMILYELSLTGCFIQKIRQPDFESLRLDIYRPGSTRFRIGIYLGNGATRIQPESSPLPPSNTNAQRFVQLLRSRIDGARIDDCRQIDSNRIVYLKLTHGSLTTDLYIRLWTGAANIIAVNENGIIIDAFFRRPAKKEVSGEVFVLPAPGNPGHFSPRPIDGPGTFGEKIAKLYAATASAHSQTQTDPRDTLSAPLRARKAQTERLLKKFEAETAAEDDGEEEKQYGDLLIACPPRPAGEKTVTVENFFDNGRPVTIPLDPKLTLRENAEAFYRRYRKKKAAAAFRLSHIEEMQAEISRLEDELTAIARLDESEAARRLTDMNRREEKIKKSVPAGFLCFESGGYPILVGRNDKENDLLLRSHVKGNDLWFHTRDVSGGFVFIKTGKKENVPEETMKDAAQLALWFSKAKLHGSADLYCTRVKHLRRAKDGPPGKVLPFHEKNISVTEDKARLKRLLGKDSSRP